MQPIHYSLIINIVIWSISGALAWKFSNPLVFIVGVLLSQHMVGRFEDQERDDPVKDGYDGSGTAGFVKNQ